MNVCVFAHVVDCVYVLMTMFALQLLTLKLIWTDKFEKGYEKVGGKRERERERERERGEEGHIDSAKKTERQTDRASQTNRTRRQRNRDRGCVCGGGGLKG